MEEEKSEEKAKHGWMDLGRNAVQPIHECLPRFSIRNTKGGTPKPRKNAITNDNESTPAWNDGKAEKEASMAAFDLAEFAVKMNVIPDGNPES